VAPGICMDCSHETPLSGLSAVCSSRSCIACLGSPVSCPRPVASTHTE
jgi:hypothetical protein